MGAYFQGTYIPDWKDLEDQKERQRLQQHAMSMDIQDRANQSSQFNSLLGTVGGVAQGGGSGGGGVGGGGTTSSGYLGLSDAEKRLSSLLDDPDSIKQSGAYKFRVGQGQEALERSLGAKGLLGSGNRLTELTKYGQDMGSQEYDTQFGRLANLLGNYQTSADRRYATNMGMLDGLRGGVNSNPWAAYTSARSANANNQMAPQQSYGGNYYWPSSSMTAGGRNQ